ncbi:MAG: propanediol utilization microcompartment protein PduB [Eubacteriaceae bacterium]|jgi:microcompartment protein PduB|nr:propanediol utilization microcompartment protein PduB [Eubacteriaceae bacterium]
MDNNEVVQKVMAEIANRMNLSDKGENMDQRIPENACSLTEFVGVAKGDTIGLVIANVDRNVHENLGIDKKYRSLGIIGARTGAGPQAMAADEAVKASNVELLIFEMARDTKGGGGHGCFIVFGAEDVSDVKRAVEITLRELDNTYFGDIYMNEAGHIELQYTARASQVLANNFGGHLGKSWGLIVGCPAGIGLVMADVAVKSANVEIVQSASPGKGTSFSNEYMIMISGDSGAVKQAVIAGREVGAQLLETLGGKLEPGGESYIR